MIDDSPKPGRALLRVRAVLMPWCTIAALRVELAAERHARRLAEDDAARLRRRWLATFPSCDDAAAADLADLAEQAMRLATRDERKGGAA